MSNMIVNGGFETGAFAPWGTSNATIDSLNSHTGFFSARLAGGSLNSFVFQYVPVTPGQDYTLVLSIAKLSASPSPPVSITVGFYTASFGFLGLGVNLTIPSGRLPDNNEEEWTEVYQAVSAVPDAATQVLVLVNKLPQNGSASVVVDDAALFTASLSPAPVDMEWGAESMYWADSSAAGPGDGTPFHPYNSLQAAVAAATSSTFATTFGMRARLVILIAANSAFDEDIVIPPARHVQLLGLGPWVLGAADLANFASSVPRNITIQTSQAAENVYLAQGPAFDARPVTVIGTFDNGTSIGTHTNYTDGATVSGNIIFQNVATGDPFTTIEFQMLNASLAGSIVQSGHMGILNAYFYNSRLNSGSGQSTVHNGLRIQRMVDCHADGVINVAGYSEITHSYIANNVTIGAVLSDVPPIGIFGSQFATIAWTGPIALDGSSNYYFVQSGSTLTGSKTVLFDTA